MLTKVEVGGENTLAIPLSGVTMRDSLIIKNLAGLSPPDITPFITNYARDGGYYSGRRTEVRNLVFTIELNPNYALGETVAGLREMLYKSFLTPNADGDFIKFTFYDDEGPDVYIVGYADKFEGELFSSDTLVQISVLCPDPYLRDNETTVIIDGLNLINTTFAYPGNAEAGFQATIQVMEATSVITLQINGKKMVLANPTTPFAVGDKILIDTQVGSLGILYVPVGSVNPISILGYLSSTSTWISLKSEVNDMIVYGVTESDLPAVVSEFSFVASYWGL